MNQIRELREERARSSGVPHLFTRRALAQRLGVAEETVARWEQDDESKRVRPRIRMARRLARELGVEVEALGLAVGDDQLADD